MMSHIDSPNTVPDVPVVHAQRTASLCKTEIERFNRTMSKLERALTVELVASDIDLGSGVWSLSTLEDDLLSYALKHQFSRVPLTDWPMRATKGITHVAEIDVLSRTLVSTRKVSIHDLISAGTS